MALSPQTKELRAQREAMRRSLENPTPEELKAEEDAADEIDRLLPPKK